MVENGLQVVPIDGSVREPVHVRRRVISPLIVCSQSAKKPDAVATVCLQSGVVMTVNSSSLVDQQKTVTEATVFFCVVRGADSFLQMVATTSKDTKSAMVHFRKGMASLEKVGYNMQELVEMTSNKSPDAYGCVLLFTALGAD